MIMGDALQARALAFGRVSVPCLAGFAASIAIAVAGCSKPYDPDAWKSAEIKPSVYRSLANSTEGDPVARRMIRGYMADGKIDYGELDELNRYDADRADRETPLESIKRELAAGDAQTSAPNKEGN